MQTNDPQPQSWYSAQPDAASQTQEPQGGSPPTGASSAQPATLDPYKLSGRFSFLGLIVLLFLSIAGGVVVGLGYAYVTDNLHFDYVFVVAMLFGCIAGIFPVLGVRVSKTRNMPLAIFAGILAGLAMYGTRNVIEAYAFRPAVVAGTVQQLVKDSHMSQSQAEGVAEHALNPWNTVLIYNQFAASAGVVLTTSDDSSTTVSGPNGTQTSVSPTASSVTGVGFYLLMLVDAVSAALASLLIASLALKLPFCESCSQWTKGSKPFVRTNYGRLQTMAQLAQSRDWAGLVRLQPTGPMDVQNYSAATLHRCARCNAGVLTVFAQAAKKVQTALRVQVDPQTTAEITANIQAKG